MGFFDTFREKANALAADAGKAGRVTAAQARLAVLQNDMRKAERDLGHETFMLIERGEISHAQLGEITDQLRAALTEIREKEAEIAALRSAGQAASPHVASPTEEATAPTTPSTAETPPEPAEAVAVPPDEATPAHGAGAAFEPATASEAAPEAPGVQIVTVPAGARSVEKAVPKKASTKTAAAKPPATKSAPGAPASTGDAAKRSAGKKRSTAD